MPKKGQMSDQDAADEIVRKNADYYNVVLHVAQRNSRVYYSSKNFDEAVAFAESIYTDENLPPARSAMVYAVDADERFALVGTTNRYEPSFKPNVVKIY